MPVSWPATWRVNKNTGWYLAMRIRRAMIDSAERALLTGIIEMDETYIRWQAPQGQRNTFEAGTRHEKAPRYRNDGAWQTGAGQSRNEPEERADCQEDVRPGAPERRHRQGDHPHRRVQRLSLDMSSFGQPTRRVNHKVWYVNGDCHTNSIVSFWALLKRGIVGQYHKVSCATCRNT